MKAPMTLAAALLAVSTSAFAQAPGPALPTEPAGLSYRYFPRQFVQWVGPELPYSMIELDVDDRGSKPVYDAVLTDRATNRRVHYCNQQMEVDIVRSGGAEAHLVPMQFESPAAASKGATYVLRFATETNTPVTWQFVQGSDITEQGGGLTPVDTATPVLVFREQAAVAGEGTALKVGNMTSAADPWKEISQPPYFVAYHGALSEDVHTLAFLPSAIEWKVDPPGAAIASAAEWTLASADGHVLRAKVDSWENGVVTLHEEHPATGITVGVQARQTPAGWMLQQLVYGPAGAAKGGHALTLDFALGERGALKFAVIAGRKTHLAGGELLLGADGAESWTLTQPAWARRAPVVATATQTSAGILTRTANPSTGSPSTEPEATRKH